MAQSFYTNEQWEWVRARRAEGYTYRELAEFLDAHFSTVAQHCVGVEVKKLRPLSKRKTEFYSLGEKRINPDNIPPAVSRYERKKGGRY